MKKAAVIGATSYFLFTLIAQTVCSLYRSQGEDLIGLLLLIPYVIEVVPLWLFCRLFGRELDAGGMSVNGGVFMGMILFNTLLGALLGAGLWKLWHFAKRLFIKKERPKN